MDSDSCFQGDEERNKITGVILVGGKSRRMGRDKAFLELDGKPLFERILEAFRETFDTLILTGDRAERFSRYNVPIYRDMYPGSALGGLYTGLYKASTPYIFVSSCDVPFPSPAVIKYLCARIGDYDAVVPMRPEGYEPLFAVYGKTCLPAMKELLDSGNLRVYDFYPRVRIRYVSVSELAAVDATGLSLINVNTPQEFEGVTRRQRDGSR